MEPELATFARAVLIGLAIAAPIGPIGVLCIRRTLTEGRASGFVSGLGAATADGVYAAVAALGLTAVSSLLFSQQLGLRVAGGAFLCYLGIRTFITRPATLKSTISTKGLLRAYVSTFALTIANPTTILSFVAIFAGMGAAAAGDASARPLFLVAGVFLGSALWWLILSGVAGVPRQRLQPPTMVWINRGSGLVIGGFGLMILVSLLR